MGKGPCSESRSISLWSAPPSVVRFSTGNIKLRFDSNVVIVVLLALHIFDPLDIRIHVDLYLGEISVV